MGALMRAHDWESSPIGPPDRWPQALKTALRMALTTRHPIFIFWGADHICFYNDGYRPSLGPEKHPALLGAPGRDHFSELWDIIGPQIELVMHGNGATWHENHLVPSYRHGRLDEVYWTYSYGPIDDETAPGGVGGVLVVCTETTQQIKVAQALRESERALKQLNEELEERVSIAVAERLREQARLAEAHDALRQAQKVETLGQLTGGVAHDFNNLLTPVLGALDLARLALADDPDVQEMVAIGLQAADRARTLVQRLLAFARRQHLEPQDIAAEDLIDAVAELAQRSLRPGIRLVLDVPEGLPAVHADPDQLVLAVLNLVLNARDAIEGVGTITVSLRAVDQPAGAVPAADGLLPGRYLCIEVRDDGSGMSPGVLERAAEPFFTTKPTGQGTGLGLASVQGLAVQSGGALTLASAAGEGCTASLWMPTSTRAAPVARSRDTRWQPPAQAQLRRILLVDDDDLVRASEAVTLRQAGFEVVQAEDADIAIGLLETEPPFDLLVTDYAMPGKTGLELANAVRVRFPTLPMLMVTGYGMAADAAPDLPRLHKPFLPGELVERVEAVIESARADTGAAVGMAR